MRMARNVVLQNTHTATQAAYARRCCMGMRHEHTRPGNYFVFDGAMVTGWLKLKITKAVEGTGRPFSDAPRNFHCTRASRAAASNAGADATAGALVTWPASASETSNMTVDELRACGGYDGPAVDTGYGAFGEATARSLGGLPTVGPFISVGGR